MNNSRVWLVFVAAGSAYALAGVFDNYVDALRCVAAFKDRFAYAQEVVLNAPLPSLLSLARRESAA